MSTLRGPPVVGDLEQVLGGVDDVGRDSQHAAVDVGSPTGEAAQCRARAGEPVGRFVDGAVAPEGHDDVVALARGLAAQLGRVIAGLGVDRVDVITAPQRVDDQILEPIRDRRGVRVYDDQHPFARSAVGQRESRLEASERVSGSGGHGATQSPTPRVHCRYALGSVSL